VGVKVAIKNMYQQAFVEIGKNIISQVTFHFVIEIIPTRWVSRFLKCFAVMEIWGTQIFC
jgi:hypothetical protein